MPIPERCSSPPLGISIFVPFITVTYPESFADVAKAWMVCAGLAPQYRSAAEYSPVVCPLRLYQKSGLAVHFSFAACI
jgi:hypothetical protein